MLAVGDLLHLPEDLSRLQNASISTMLSYHGDLSLDYTPGVLSCFQIRQTRLAGHGVMREAGTHFETAHAPRGAT